MLRHLERASDGVRHGERSAVALGVRAIDNHLPGGGLMRPGIHHICGPDDPDRHPDGSAAAFALRLAARLQRCESSAARPVLWIEDASALSLYGPGLAQWGLDPAQLYMLQSQTLTERLWAMEEALRSGAVAGAVVTANKLDLTASRRLLLAAKTGGSLGIVLSSAAKSAISPGLMSRWRLQMHRPHGWQVALERCRGTQPASWVLDMPASGPAE